ncbi:hypothetical protein SALBM217S_04311 [Streptomyces griseoloalbus]
MHATGSTAAGRRGPGTRAATDQQQASGPAGVGYIHVSRTPSARPPEARIPRAGLTADRLVAAAADLADEAGYENVTLSALARRFHVKDASLYAHVRGLRDLRTRMALLAGGEMIDRIAAAVEGRTGRTRWPRSPARTGATPSATRGGTPPRRSAWTRPR